MGYMIRERGLDDGMRNKWLVTVSAVILLAALLLGLKYGCQASAINAMDIGFPMIFVSGIVVINLVSYYLEGKKGGTLFAVIGDFSFSIMALHFVGFKLVTYLRSLTDDRIILTSFPTDRTDIYYWAPVYIFVGILLPILLSALYDKIKYAWNNNRRLQKSGKNG